MKNSNEWINDIERKLNERYSKRNKRRKFAIKCAGGFASCSLILIAALALPKNTIPNFDEQIIDNSVTESTTQHEENTTFTQNTESDNSSSSNITTENSGNSIGDTTETPTISESDNYNDISETYPDNTQENTRPNIQPTTNRPNVSPSTKPITTQPTTKPIPTHPNTQTSTQPITTRPSTQTTAKPTTTNTHTQPSTHPITTTLPSTQPTEASENPTEPPTYNPPTTDEYGFNINKILKVTPLVSSSSSAVHEYVSWSYQQITDYYGIDFRALQSSVFSDSDYSADISDEYIVGYNNEGSLETDIFVIGYHDSYGRNVKISASRVTVPYNCIYESESKEASYIDGIPTIIGGMSTSGSDDYNFFYADFQKNGVNYRFTGEGISQKEFCKIISNFITM